MGSKDYQEFGFDQKGKLTNIGPLMAEKLKTLPEVWCKGSVLDVGTDHGFWCFYAVEHGAKYALGIDRGREVKGQFVDLAARNNRLAEAVGADNAYFAKSDIGKQWTIYTKFDTVLVFSSYHHIYNNCEDHDSIWNWLSLHTKGRLYWEGPVSRNDPVVVKDVKNSSNYTEAEISEAASKYFTRYYIQNSPIHGREVWELVPKPRETFNYRGVVHAGAGGASKAFNYNNRQRIKDLTAIIGWEPVPGTLNIRTDENFRWDRHYLRAKLPDVIDRKAGLNSPWAPRWCRFYRVILNNLRVTAMRFEGESYNANFIEVISEQNLRYIKNLNEGSTVELTQI